MTFEQHIKQILAKNTWYGENYGIKHVITESNLDNDFKAQGITILAKGHHETNVENINGYCFHTDPHYHYIIEVPMHILAEAYDQKRSWATICGLQADIIKTKGHGTIKTLEHLQHLKRYIDHYEEDLENESHHNDSCHGDHYEEESEDESIMSNSTISKYEEKIKRIKKQQKHQETLTKFKQSEIIKDKYNAKQSEKRAQELQLRTREQREKLFNSVRGLHYLNENEKKDLERELLTKEDILKIFPKWLRTTQQDVDEAKAGVETQIVLRKITNAYAYIQQCKMNDLHTQKNKPLTIDEIAIIETLPGYKHTKKYMLKMMHSMYTKLYRDNKCCIFWICGVPSSGKSLFMSILGNIMGPRVGLDKTQLYQDTLYANKLCEKNAASVTFEEYDLNSEKRENVDKAIAKLKALTSGKPESFRIALNQKQTQNKNDILNIKLVVITSNQHFTDIWSASSDSGFRDRLCTQQIDEQIPAEVRYKLDSQYDMEIMYTRYFYQIWKNWVANGAPNYDDLPKIPYHINTISAAKLENKLEILKIGCILPQEETIATDKNMSLDY